MRITGPSLSQISKEFGSQPPTNLKKEKRRCRLLEYSTPARLLLVPGKKYSKIRVLSLYGRSDNRRGFTIYIFNPCFRIILAWDEYQQHRVIR